MRRHTRRRSAQAVFKPTRDDGGGLRCGAARRCACASERLAAERLTAAAAREAERRGATTEVAPAGAVGDGARRTWVGARRAGSSVRGRPASSATGFPSLIAAVERAGACEALTTASDGPPAGGGGGATLRGARGAACAAADEATERGGRHQTRAVRGACCGVEFRRLRVATAWVESEVTRRAAEPAA